MLTSGQTPKTLGPSSLNLIWPVSKWTGSLLRLVRCHFAILPSFCYLLVIFFVLIYFPQFIFNLLFVSTYFSNLFIIYHFFFRFVLPPSVQGGQELLYHLRRLKMGNSGVTSSEFSLNHLNLDNLKLKSFKI